MFISLVTTSTSIGSSRRDNQDNSTDTRFTRGSNFLKRAKLDKDLAHIGRKRALFIGFAQALALIPGTSRSGITITAGEYLGLNRESAARFSFLLATPISLGAGMYKFLQLLTDKDASGTVSATVLGIIVAFVVGILVIKWFLDYLKKHTLLAFVVYRVVLGLTVISIWLMRSL